MPKFKWDFRDVSVGLKMIREFLLGRRHDLENMHPRFLPRLAPRSIPAPDIPRGPIYKYSNQYYCNRSVVNSVKPPVVAPYAEGPAINLGPTQPFKRSGVIPSTISFSTGPTPGLAWWWDGHCYYDFIRPPPKKVMPLPPCPEPKKAPPPKGSTPSKARPKTDCEKKCEGK